MGNTRKHTAWWTFVQRELDARGWSGADFQRASDIDRSRLNAWRDKHAMPTTQMARTVAETFGVPVLQAFIAAGFLTAEEARAQPAAPAALPLSEATNTQLLRELGDRLDAAGQGASLTRAEIEADPERYEVLNGGIETSKRRHRTDGRPVSEA